jgi:hypothetical protein
LIAQSFQVFEKAPEHHAPVILSAGALDEGEPSLDALKLLFDDRTAPSLSLNPG